MSEELARMEAEIGMLREQMARQEAELTRLRGADAVEDSGESAARRTSRRRMLKQMGMAAVGVAAMNVAARTGENAVEAADGGNLVLGTTNIAESQTVLAHDGVGTPTQLFEVTSGGNLTAFRAAIAGAGLITNNPVGVYGFSDQAVANSFGVVGYNLAGGTGSTGVYGTAGPAGTGVGGT